jgi:hypothetical protein
MRRTALSVLGVLVFVGLATVIAGEVVETVIVHGYDADGTVHNSKVWVVDIDGTPWVRVGRGGRTWGERLRSNPRAELVRNGITTARIATLDDGPETRARVDAAFAEKYGLVDWWFGVVIRKNPIPIRLDPAPTPPA